MAVVAGCVRSRRHSYDVAADVRGAPPPAMEAPPPLLVQLLGGNVVTSAFVLSCINTVDATVLRRLHPALAAAIEAVPWATDAAIRVHDTARWRAALPAATALKLAPKKEPLSLCRGEALAALSSVTSMDLARCLDVTNAVIARLPPTLRALHVAECRRLSCTSFLHLLALESLDCSNTNAVTAGVAHLPPSLRKLRMHNNSRQEPADFSHLQNLRVLKCKKQSVFTVASAASLPPSLEELDISKLPLYIERSELPPAWSIAHLNRLRVFYAVEATIDNAAIATLPPSLLVLNLNSYKPLSSAVSFVHLTCLHTLRLCGALIDSGTLATLPLSLVSLDLYETKGLTLATVFPPLPELRELNVSYTNIGDAAVASMPAALVELHMTHCRNVTQRASLDHLVALRVVQNDGTDLSSTTIEACLMSGCATSAN